MAFERQDGKTVKMTRIRRIELSGFRGARLPISIDFGNRCASAVILGRNGQGKSTFVDALEFYISGSIEHLQRESVARAAYRNRAISDEEMASVRVEFSEAGLGGSIRISVDQRLILSNDSESAATLRSALAEEMVILRHQDLARFVNMTKGEKLSELAPLIGLAALADVRAVFRGTKTRMESDLDENRRALDDRGQSIEETLGEAPATDGRLWTLIGELLDDVGVSETVENAGGLQSALESVSVAVDPERDRVIKSLREARTSIAALPASVEAFSSVDTFAVGFNALVRDPVVLREMQLVEVWQAGRSVVASEWWEDDVCPLCGEAKVKHELTEEIDHHLLSAAEAQEKATVLNRLRSTAQDDANKALTVLNEAAIKIADIEECESMKEMVEGELLTIVTDLRAVLATRIDVGAEPIDPLAAWRISAESVLAIRQQCLNEIDGSVDDLALTDLESGRLASYRRLSSLETDLRYSEGLARTGDVIASQAASMGELLSRFEDHERSSMAAVLDRISENVSRYYVKLHGDETYDNVRLEFLAEARGLEFSLEAYGLPISPPRLMLSESHLNSLGLCLFLASAREFNSEAEFLVLDDVVNSFDEDHRANLAALLVTEFGDRQVIAFTHDPVWFDTLRRAGSGWQQRRLGGWTLESGIEIIGSVADEQARIEGFLSSGVGGGEVIAGNLARSFAERRLKHLCTKLLVLVPYREGYQNERRTGHELFTALHQHCRSRTRFENASAPIWEQFEASAFLANLASHDQPVMATTLSGGDIRFAMQKIEELVSIFRCVSCNKWVWTLRENPTDEKSQCECGQLRI